MGLPQDNFILLSLVNMRLRDGQQLSDFCAEYGAEEGELISRLAAAGYYFDGDENAFKGV